MVKNLDKAIKTVQSGGDLKKLSRLKTQLDRLNAIGGTKAIVPSEGLVFKYKGKTYKDVRINHTEYFIYLITQPAGNVYEYLDFIK